MCRLKLASLFWLAFLIIQGSSASTSKTQVENVVKNLTVLQADLDKIIKSFTPTTIITTISSTTSTTQKSTSTSSTTTKQHDSVVVNHEQQGNDFDNAVVFYNPADPSADNVQIDNDAVVFTHGNSPRYSVNSVNDDNNCQMVLKAINDTTKFANTLDLATLAYDQTVNEVEYLHRDLMIAANNTKDCQQHNVVEKANAARKALQEVIDKKDKVEEMFNFDWSSPYTITFIVVSCVLLILMVVTMCQLCSVHRQISKIAGKQAKKSEATVEIEVESPPSRKREVDNKRRLRPHENAPIHKERRSRVPYEDKMDGEDDFGVWAVNESKQQWRDSFYGRIEDGHINYGIAVEDEMEMTPPQQQRGGGHPQRTTGPYKSPVSRTSSQEQRVVSRHPRDQGMTTGGGTGAIPRAVAAKAIKRKERGENYDYSY